MFFSQEVSADPMPKAAIQGSKSDSSLFSHLNNPALFYAALAVVLLVAVIVPRMAALGDFIHMDEGYHDYMARYIQQSYARGEGFPQDLTGYKLYNFLFYWVYFLPGNGSIWLRLADLLLACACGIVFCFLLCRESGSRVAGLLLCAAFYSGMNEPLVIDSGFKNSFFPSFLCLFLAVYITTGHKCCPGRWFWAGCLTATAILFRETFFLFPVLVCLALLLNKGFAALWRFVLGGIVTAILLTIALMIIRGQVWEIFQFYFIYGKIYGPEAGRRWIKFVQNGARALWYFSPLVILTIFSLIAAIRQKRIHWHNRSAFWLACAVIPLLEPFSKIGFLYHFSACLPGMAGLCAHVWADMKYVRKIWLYGMGLAAILMQPFMYPHYGKLPVTLETLQAWPEPGWPETLTSQSNTLRAARAIQEHTGRDDTLASSGFAYFLFPASQRNPPEMGLGDLSRTLIYADFDADAFRQRLDANPPDIAAIGTTKDDHSAIFEKELTSIFAQHPDYEYVQTITPDPALNYGWLGYHIYKRKDRAANAAPHIP